MNKENKWQVTGRVASNLIVVFAGVAFYMALSNFDALRAQLRAWLGILSPFVWGLVIAYLLALVCGIGLGAFIGSKNLVRKNLTPYINAFSAIPVTLLTPYAINLFPSFRIASIFIIFLGCFWIILGSTITAVMTIDKRYLENAATLERPRMQRLFRIVLPAASPAIITGCTISLKLAFTLLAVAEMFGATSGMGYFIQYYSDFGRFDLVAVGFIFMAIVLVIILYVFDLIKNRLLYWTINN